MIATLLFVAFLGMMFLGVPIGAALGLAGATAIAVANAEAPWFGLLAVPQNFYAGLGKYPLLAIPMFVLVGSIFDRSGVALRLVNFAIALVGRGPGMLPLVAICVAMFLGGISGSGPTLFALCDKPDTAQRVADWLSKHYLQNQEGFVHICRLDTAGARVVG